jgi:hypothetical protein
MRLLLGLYCLVPVQDLAVHYCYRCTANTCGAEHHALHEQECAVSRVTRVSVCGKRGKNQAGVVSALCFYRLLLLLEELQGQCEADGQHSSL